LPLRRRESTSCWASFGRVSRQTMRSTGPYSSSLLHLTLSCVPSPAPHTQPATYSARIFRRQAEYNCYLCYIFNALKSEAGPVRQMAGLVLKNNLKEHWDSLRPDVQEWVGPPFPSVRVFARARARERMWHARNPYSPLTVTFARACWAASVTRRLTFAPRYASDHPRARAHTGTAAAASTASAGAARSHTSADAPCQAGSCITTVTSGAGLQAWPQLIPSLYQVFRPRPHIQDHEYDCRPAHAAPTIRFADAG